MSLKVPFRRSQESRNAGTAAVEFAIIAPLLVLLGIGLADYGGLVATSAGLEGAARAGAEVVLSNPGVTAAQLNNLGLIPTVFASSPSPTFSLSLSCTCVNNSTVSPCPPAVNTTPCASVTNPYTNSPDQRVLVYEAVTVTQSSFASLVSFSNFLFPSSLSASALVRRQ
jgi:Flp pilus assembly protein TadG